LGWSIEKTSAVGARIVNELPLVVVILIVEHADTLSFAGAGYADDGAASKNLAGASASTKG
jgi:hypothetical protein